MFSEIRRRANRESTNIMKQDRRMGGTSERVRDSIIDETGNAT